MRVLPRLVIIMLVPVLAAHVRASVSGYTLASSNTTYTPISGTTVASGTWDDTNFSLVSLPFTFTYNNVAYTSVGISTNGFITLGALTTTVYCGLQTSPPNSIAGYGTDFVNASASSSVIYTTSGSAPNRRFIVQ